MNKILCASIAALAFGIATPAFAADLPVKARPMPPPPPPATWTGFYFGGNVGYGAGTTSVGSNTFFTAPPFSSLVVSSDLSTSGAIGGGQIGYNWQLAPTWLIGVEADFDWADQHGQLSAVNNAAPPSVITVESKLDWLATVRGRFGYITGNTLWYVTGGWADGRRELNVASSFAAPTAVGALSSTVDKSGWTAGAGVETKLWNSNWSAKLEYLHVDLGTMSSTFNLVPAPPLANTTTAKFRDEIVRVGLNYQFAALAFGGATPAFAADLPVTARPMPPPPPATWTGVYIGGNVGYGSGTTTVGSNMVVTGPPPFSELVVSSDLSTRGAIGGGQIGYNWQLAPTWLIGIEADFDWADQRGQVTASGASIPPLVTTVESKLDWLATVRGRFGYTAGNTLWYVTGGWADGRRELNVASSFNVTSVVGALSSTVDKSGWTAGAGVETKLWSSNWSAKLEYLHVDLGTMSSTFNLVPAPNFILGSPLVTTTTAKFRDEIVRVGLNYKFW